MYLYVHIQYTCIYIHKYINTYTHTDLKFNITIKTSLHGFEVVNAQKERHLA